MPTAQKPVKQPQDHKEKADSSPDPTMKFTRDGKTFESLPMSQALTAELVLEQPDPDQCTDWEKMQFSLKLTVSAFRNDPDAVGHVMKMTMSEIGELNEDVEREAGVSLGE